MVVCPFFPKEHSTWEGGSVTEGSVKKGVVFMCYVLIENVTSGRPTDQELTTIEKLVRYSQFPRGGCTPPWCSVGKYQVKEEAGRGDCGQEPLWGLPVRKRSTRRRRANQPISMALVRYLALGYLQHDGSGLECERQRTKGSGMLEGQVDDYLLAKRLARLQMSVHQNKENKDVITTRVQQGTSECLCAIL